MQDLLCVYVFVYMSAYTHENVSAYTHEIVYVHTPLLPSEAFRAGCSWFKMLSGIWRRDSLCFGGGGARLHLILSFVKDRADCEKVDGACDKESN